MLVFLVFFSFKGIYPTAKQYSATQPNIAQLHSQAFPWKVRDKWVKGF